MGQTRRSSCLGMSASPPTPDVSLQGNEPTLRAMCGRLQVGKENLHVAGLVGAAMCSASHDGISVKS